MPGANTRVFALLGDPVGHSLSPAMHNAAFRALGLDAVYVALRCDADRLPALMQALASAGGGGNVTVPHKGTAAAALAVGPAAGAGACNTFWSESGLLAGANTDPDGVLHALARLGVAPLRWLIVGTGGSARGCVEAARRAGVAVAFRSRAAERATALQAGAETVGVPAADPAECDLVINATPVGLQDSDAIPISLADAPAAQVVLDLVYRSGETAWVRAARAAGRRASDGREVLLGQGLAAFRRWFPDHDPPAEVMRAAVRAGLG